MADYKKEWMEKSSIDYFSPYKYIWLLWQAADRRIEKIILKVWGERNIDR